jgi:hypothetical protein
MPTSRSDPASGIRRLGFRRWYERQLLESHFWLVSCILAMLLVAVCIETFRSRRARRRRCC